MATTWILVANRSTALIYQSRGPGIEWEVLKKMVHPEGRMKNSELASDSGGRNNTADGRGSRPAVEWSTSPREAEARKFAQEIAAELSEGRVHQKYDRLLLVTSPEFMGKVKECLDSQVQEKIIETITKDYVTLPVKDVREKVNSVILV